MIADSCGPGGSRRWLMVEYRSQLPTVLKGIGAFDRDAHELDQAALIRLIKACPMFDQLRDRTGYDQGGARTRMSGEWVLADVAFANSMVNDIKPWWKDSNAERWEAGFTGRPKYDIVYARFRELDEKGAAEELFEASAKLIRLAHVCSGGLVGLDVLFDFTKSETHASIKHDCQDGECPGFGKRTTRRPSNARYRKTPTETARQDRQEKGQSRARRRGRAEHRRRREARLRQAPRREAHQGRRALVPADRQDRRRAGLHRPARRREVLAGVLRQQGLKPALGPAADDGCRVGL
ncbi:MAG: hypothetical protein ABSG43_17800 [Solirubrobacteraceae bacterium]